MGLRRFFPIPATPPREIKLRLQQQLARDAAALETAGHVGRLRQGIDALDRDLQPA